MKRERLMWMPWYGDDYENDPDVMALSLAGDVVYRRALWLEWKREGLGLRDDIAWLEANLGHKVESFREVWQEVAGFYETGDDGSLHNKRLAEEWREAVEKHRRAVESGRKGGRRTAAQRREATLQGGEQRRLQRRSTPSPSPSPSPAPSQEPSSEGGEDARADARPPPADEGASISKGAKTLACDYVSRVKGANRRGVERAIEARLGQDGRSPEELERAIHNYHSECEAYDLDETRRKSGSTFFRMDGDWEGYAAEDWKLVRAGESDEERIQRIARNVRDLSD